MSVRCVRLHQYWLRQELFTLPGVTLKRKTPQDDIHNYSIAANKSNSHTLMPLAKLNTTCQIIPTLHSKTSLISQMSKFKSCCWLVIHIFVFFYHLSGRRDDGLSPDLGPCASIPGGGAQLLPRGGDLSALPWGHLHQHQVSASQIPVPLVPHFTLSHPEPRSTPFC